MFRESSGMNLSASVVANRRCRLQPAPFLKPIPEHAVCAISTCIAPVHTGWPCPYKFGLYHYAPSSGKLHAKRVEVSHPAATFHLLSQPPSLASTLQSIALLDMFQRMALHTSGVYSTIRKAGWTSQDRRKVGSTVCDAHSRPLDVM